MKYKAFIPLISTLLFLTVVIIPINSQSHDVVLKEQAGWEIDSLASGLIKYTYRNYYQLHRANQLVHVLEVDYASPRYSIDIKYASPSDSLSSVARSAGAIVGINGSYELDATFVKTNGKIHSQVSLSSSHLRFWKHEGAIFYNNLTKTAALQYGTNNEYFSSNSPNILSGAPMLIDNYNPVGTTFIGDVTGINLNSLDYEDYRRHQGVRHPRTAVALTESNKMLLIVVDGRRNDVSAGMNAKEFTEFLVRYFNPKSALNIDGGGSSTMYIKGSNVSSTDVVNYPTDNDRFDHYGQRSVRTFILVKQEANNDEYAGGTGTAADPYLISTAEHLNNIRKTDWANAINNKPYFKLVNDIDLAGIGWLPVNNTDPYAQLHFDGNGHVIKNMSVKGVPYASLFGVLCGSCRNLGVINATVESTNGGGIISGYVGIKTPSSAAYTGAIENCYTSGIVSGSDGVGGIAGNIGKPDTSIGIASIIRNCYSTATVLAKNTTNNARAGGIAGIIFDKGVLENSYATGTVTSSMYGAGGIAGWSDASLKGVVALNDSIINTSTGNIGRIAAFMGEVGGIQAQGINCWGSENTVMDDAGTFLGLNVLNEGTVTVRNASYDGSTKNKEYLSNPMNYFLELEWDFASDINVWAQTMSNGRPIFQWLLSRNDYALIDGHGGTTQLKPSISGPKLNLFVYDKEINVQSAEKINMIVIYNASGNEVLRQENTGFQTTVKINQTGIYVLVANVGNRTISRKFIMN